MTHDGLASHGVFTPAPGSAPLPRMVAAQARMETRLLLRNGEQLLLAVVIPLVVLVGGILAARGFDLSLSAAPVDLLTPGVLALAVMSTSFTSLAIATGFERRYGVLKRLGSSPLPRSGLLAGKVGALLVVETIQLVVLGAAGLALGWSPTVTAAGVVGALVVVLARHRRVRRARAADGRDAAGRGDAGRREPGLPAAAGRRRGRAPGLVVRRHGRGRGLAALGRTGRGAAGGLAGRGVPRRCRCSSWCSGRRWAPS